MISTSFLQPTSNPAIPSQFPINVLGNPYWITPNLSHLIFFARVYRHAY